MTIRKRAIAVKQVPETPTVPQEQAFLRELQSAMQGGRPFVVLDCSNLRRFDRPVVYLLLCCLEEAMKRNGDVKLAALPSDGAAVLEATGAGRLFDLYDTTADAMHSFDQPRSSATLYGAGPESAA